MTNLQTTYVETFVLKYKVDVQYFSNTIDFILVNGKS